MSFHITFEFGDWVVETPNGIWVFDTLDAEMQEGLAMLQENLGEHY